MNKQTLALMMLILVVIRVIQIDTISFFAK